MADRGIHVDIFFRNGLKEFEVLPPPEVWDNIKPVLRKRQKSLSVVRFAAIATILLSLSVFSYWLKNKVSKDFNGAAISFNQEVIPEGTYIPKNQPLTNSLIKIPVKNQQIAESVPVSETVSPEQMYFKISYDGLLSTAIKESKLKMPIKPVVSYVHFIGIANSHGIENLNLALDNSVIKNTVNDLNRWTISAMASPNYFSSIRFGNNEASNNSVYSEKPLVSYSGGLAFSYRMNKRISIQSGLYYSSLGQNVTGISSFAGFRNYYDAKGGSGFNIETSIGTIVSTNLDVFLVDNISTRVLTKYAFDYFDPIKANLTYLNNSIIQKFGYLEMPVLFKYKAIDRKMDLNLIGGISYNMLVGNSAFSYQDGVKYLIGKTEGMNPINFSSSFSLGFEYNFSEKISLNLEPTFKYYLTPMGRLVGPSIHPYSFGFFSGLSYKF